MPGDTVEPLGYSLLVLASTLAAAAVGFVIHKDPLVKTDNELILLSGESALGLAATLTAVVLGIITASSAADFDQANQAVATVAADTLDVDRILENYGPDAAPIRVQLRDALQHWAERLEDPKAYYAADSIAGYKVGGLSEPEIVYAAIANLKPSSGAQRELQQRALKIAGNRDLAEQRSLFVVGTASLPRIFVIMVLVWMVLEFLCFGLISPRTPAVYLLIVVSAFVVSSSLFLILELKDPIDGFIRVSVEPLHRVSALLDR